MFTPTRANPRIFEETEEDASGDDEEFNPPLNQEGLNPTFDSQGYLPSPYPQKGKRSSIYIISILGRRRARYDDTELPP